MAIRARADALVLEVPDEAALQRGVPADQVPILGKPAERVAHRVSVLGHDQRHGAVARGVGLELLGVRVHGHDQVRVPVHLRPVRLVKLGVQRGDQRALVLDRPRRVAPLHVLIGRVEGDAVPRLISERPDEHRRVVLVPFHHRRRPLHVCIHPLGPPRQRRLGPTGAMTLNVRLVDKHEAVTVGEAQPERVVGVVRGAHGVDVEQLDGREVA